MPSYAELHHNLGVALLALGRLAEAAGWFRHALTLKPDLVESHQSLGEALAGLEEWPAAVQAYGEALALEPGSTSTLINHGVAFREMGRPDDALATFRGAVALDPTSVALHNQIGLTLYDQGDGVGAVHWFAQASELDPTDDCAAMALGRALLSLDRPVEAEVPLRRATMLLPESPEAFFSLGVSLKKQGRWHEAVTPFSRTLQLEPDHHEARRWRAGARLVTGDFEGGFEDFLRVLRNVDGLTRPLPGPTWDGSSLSGRTLLLYAEQGFGDAVLFARFLPQTKELGGTVLLEVPQTLARLFEGAEGVDRLLVTGEELPHYDTHAPLTHVAALLGATVDTIPATVAYLSAGADVVACKTLPARAVPSELRVGGESDPRERRQSVDGPGRPRAALDDAGAPGILAPGWPRARSVGDSSGRKPCPGSRGDVRRLRGHRARYRGSRPGDQRGHGRGPSDRSHGQAAGAPPSVPAHVVLAARARGLAVVSYRPTLSPNDGEGLDRGRRPARPDAHLHCRAPPGSGESPLRAYLGCGCASAHAFAHATVRPNGSCMGLGDVSAATLDEIHAERAMAPAGVSVFDALLGFACHLAASLEEVEPPHLTDSYTF